MAKLLCKKQNGSVGVMLFSMFFLILIAILLVVYVQQSSVAVKTSRMNGSVESVLSSSVKNTMDFKSCSEAGGFVMSDDGIKNMYFKFKDNICSSLDISKDGISDEDYARTFFIGRADGSDNVLKGDVIIKKFKVYSVSDSGTIDISDMQPDGNIVRTRGTAVSTYLPEDVCGDDKIPVKNSCLYTQVEYNIKGYFGAEATVAKGYLVMLVNNQPSLWDGKNFGNNVPQKGK